jgi:hypothetical protein
VTAADKSPSDWRVQTTIAIVSAMRRSQDHE